MKRCPRCDRVEYDDALAFCRLDGTALVSNSASLANETGTATFRPISSEIETSILPHATNAVIDRGTAPTTALPPSVLTKTSEKPATSKSRRKLLIAIAGFIILVAAGIIAGYAFLWKKNSKNIQSIAVMPLVNAGGNADLEYLSDGLTESLINSLSQIPDLSVKARSTVFRYKGRDISPQQLGSELSVQTLLNGRVVQRGDQLTVSIDLVNAGTGDQIWGQQYVRNVSDLVSLHTAIANDLSQKLRADISHEDRQRLVKGSTANPEAYLLYLNGRYHTAKYTRDGLAKGRDYFNQALALDPQYALAYDGLADNYIAASDWFMSSKEALPKAGAAARKALEFNDKLPEAHTSLGIVHWWFDWNWAAAEAEFKRAIDLNPNDAHAHEFYGWFLITLGKLDAGIAESKRALALDPLSAETGAVTGSNLYFARHYDEAIEMLRGALDLDQNYWLAHSFLGRCYQQQRRLTEAIAEFQRTLDVEKDVPENYAVLAHAYGTAGKKSDAEKLLAQLQDMSTKRHVPPYNIALVYVGLGNKDQAFAWLERAYADRSFYMTWLRNDPQLDTLRSDPRFDDLMHRVGLP